MAETKARVLQDRVLKFRHPTRIFAQSRNPENLLGTLTTKQDSQIDMIGLFCPLRVANQDAAIKMKKKNGFNQQVFLFFGDIYSLHGNRRTQYHISSELWAPGFIYVYKSLLLVRHKSVAKNGELRS